MGNNEPKNTWYVNLLKILKLETTTPSGRINLAGIFILAIFCLLYTTYDAFMYFVSATSDTIKSIELNQDISHPYETVSVFRAVLPVFLGFVICLFFLWYDNKRRDELTKNDKIDNDNPNVENPIDKI